MTDYPFTKDSLLKDIFNKTLEDKPIEYVPIIPHGIFLLRSFLGKVDQNLFSEHLSPLIHDTSVYTTDFGHDGVSFGYSLLDNKILTSIDASKQLFEYKGFTFLTHYKDILIEFYDNIEECIYEVACYLYRTKQDEPMTQTEYFKHSTNLESIITSIYRDIDISVTITRNNLDIETYNNTLNFLKYNTLTEAIILNEGKTSEVHTKENEVYTFKTIEEALKLKLLGKFKHLKLASIGIYSLNKKRD